MNVLAIVGSPKRNGNLARISKKVLQGAEQSGHKVELLNLYDHDIKECTGCWQCAKAKRCHIKDDFADIIARVREADVIVLGSPVYWGNVTGKMKTFFDRHTGDVMLKPENADEFCKLSKMDKIKTMIYSAKHFGPADEFKNKKFIIVATCTVPKMVGYLNKDLSSTLTAMKIHVRNMNGKIIAKIIYADTLFQFSKNKKKSIMQKAYNIGLSL